MPRKRDKTIETVILCLLNVALPTFDVYSDLVVSINFFIGSRSNPACDELFDNITDRIKCYYNDTISTLDVTYTPHVTWGTIMLVPFLLNYIICWYVWATTEKKKALSWVAALLSFYPQYVACKVIWLIWNDPKNGCHEKRKLERNMVQMETYLEAVPSTMVYTYVLVKATGGPLVHGQELIFRWYDPNDSVLFFLGYATSVFSSTMGLAKSLKVGPVRILAEKKNFLGGLLSPQFVLIFFACGFTLASKAFAFALAVEGSCDPVGTERSVGAIIASTLFFAPGILVSLFSCWHRGLLRTLLAHPSIILLPAYSYFTCASSERMTICGKSCNQKNDSRVAQVEETYIAFSPKYTAVNAALTTGGFLVYASLMPTLTEYYRSSHDPIRTLKLLPELSRGICFGEVYIGGGVPCFLLGLLFSIVVAFPDNCCRSSRCCSDWEPLEFAALQPSSLETPRIVLQTGKGETIKAKTEENS